MSCVNLAAAVHSFRVAYEQSEVAGLFETENSAIIITAATVKCLGVISRRNAREVLHTALGVGFICSPKL